MQQELKNIPTNRILADSNYRKTFREKSLQELSASIKVNGVLEPIIVRPATNFDKTGKYRIIAGERRYRACQLAGLVTIPAVIRDTDDADVLTLQLIENVQRESVPYMEEAYAVKKLRDDQTLDVHEIAKTIGKSENYVYMMLRLATLPDDVRAIAEKGWISKSVAWELTKLTVADHQVEAANALARTQSDRLITASGAKHYIRDNFGDSANRKKRERVAKFGPGSTQYVANWKKYLVNFSADQFEHFKKIVRGRTETEILAEAVDLVMRRENDGELANAMNA